jgi:RNA polymerase sigma-70 factor (ECF subfamily)
VKGVKTLPDEQLLLETFSNGDFTYIDVLICRYEDSLFNLCLKLTKNRHDAEELYQQTWLKAIQKSHTCAKSMKNWLYTICLNAYRDSYRRSKRESEVIENTLDNETKDYVIAAATDNVSAESEALKKLTGEVLMNRVNSLPDKHRLPIILYYFEGLDYKESAAVLGLPIGTVKSRLNAAKSKLRKEMENELNV